MNIYRKQNSCCIASPIEAGFGMLITIRLKQQEMFNSLNQRLAASCMWIIEISQWHGAGDPPRRASQSRSVFNLSMKRRLRPGFLWPQVWIKDYWPLYCLIPSSAKQTPQGSAFERPMGTFQGHAIRALPVSKNSDWKYTHIVQWESYFSSGSKTAIMALERGKLKVNT